MAYTSSFNLSLKIQTIFTTTEYLDLDVWHVPCTPHAQIRAHCLILLLHPLSRLLAAKLSVIYKFVTVDKLLKLSRPWFF